MKKKMISAAMAFVLCLSLTATAFASTTITEGSSEQSGKTTITTTTDPTYTVTIPADTAITFGATSTDLGSVSLDSARLESGYVVTVSASAGALTNDDDANSTIAYTLNDKDGVFTSVVFDTAGDSTALTVDIEQAEWDAACAGSYTGTITFTVSYAKTATE